LKALAVVPWRAGDKYRVQNFHFVTTHLDACGVDWTTADADPAQPFSRSATKNLGAKLAEKDGADVVIFHDADMLVPCDAYQTMAERCVAGNNLIVGHTQYRPLDFRITAEVLKGKRADPFQAPAVQVLSGWCLGGVIAITVDNFFTVGGFDERFNGWGCEDTAFAHSCNVVLNVLERTENRSVHLWHPHAAPKANPQALQANTRLLTRYTSCATIEELREVQSTP